ncbi:hypothetical protein N665_0078s0096 [Sinapis alba]|nr:hypothetical protein N665_0078s0096 [Sinapis alba]
MHTAFSKAKQQHKPLVSSKTKLHIKKMELELDLDLSLSPHSNSSNFGFDFDLNKHLNTKEKRFEAMLGLETMEEDCYVRRSDKEDDDPLEPDSSVVYDEEENCKVVGWPPVKSCMTKYLNYRHHSRNHSYHHHGRRINISNQPATIERVRRSTTSMYVKVKMDGVAITRKVDIKLFDSYESLTNSLITMFSQYQDCDREDTNFKFTFQGKEGDWLLPGDAPWKIFAESVYRISITRDCLCPYTRFLF